MESKPATVVRPSKRCGPHIEASERLVRVLRIFSERIAAGAARSARVVVGAGLVHLTAHRAAPTITRYEVESGGRRGLTTGDVPRKNRASRK